MPDYAIPMIWGLFGGLIMLPAYVIPLRLVDRFEKPNWPLAPMILHAFVANLLGCVGVGAAFVAVLKLSGVNAYHPHAQYFGWSFVLGAVLCLAIVGLRRRLRKDAA